MPFWQGKLEFTDTIHGSLWENASQTLLPRYETIRCHNGEDQIITFNRCEKLWCHKTKCSYVHECRLVCFPLVWCHLIELTLYCVSAALVSINIKLNVWWYVDECYVVC
jgi:hypothetical protein